jgi:hypothetical protein
MFFWLSGPGLKRTPRTQDKTPMYKIAEAPHFLRLAMFLGSILAVLKPGLGQSRN